MGVFPVAAPPPPFPSPTDTHEATTDRRIQFVRTAPCSFAAQSQSPLALRPLLPAIYAQAKKGPKDSSKNRK